MASLLLALLTNVQTVAAVTTSNCIICGTDYRACPCDGCGEVGKSVDCSDKGITSLHPSAKVRLLSKKSRLNLSGNKFTALNGEGIFSEVYEDPKRFIYTLELENNDALVSIGKGVFAGLKVFTLCVAAAHTCGPPTPSS